MLFILAWVCALAWLPLQAYALFRLRGWRRVVSGLPILPMLPVLWITYDGYESQSNLWPLLLMFVSPIAVLWVLVPLLGELLSEQR